MPTILQVFLTLVALYIVLKIINHFTNPVVRVASRRKREIRRLRAMLRLLPEGQLLNVVSYQVQQMGEAMVIDGATTREANAAMLELLEELLLAGLNVPLIESYQPTTKVVAAKKE